MPVDEPAKVAEPPESMTASGTEGCGDGQHGRGITRNLPDISFLGIAHLPNAPTIHEIAATAVIAANKEATTVIAFDPCWEADHAPPTNMPATRKRTKIIKCMRSRVLPSSKECQSGADRIPPHRATHALPLYTPLP